MAKTNSELLNSLEELGLSEKEARIYLASVELGPTTISRLAKLSGVKRTTIHEIIDGMILRGLIHVSVSGKRKLYGPLEPKGLGRLLDRQKEIVGRIVPELTALGQKSPSKPRIRLYEGVEGVEFAYMEAVSEPDSSYSNYSDFSQAYKVVRPGFFDKWIKAKIDNRVSSRTILPTDEYADMHTREDKKELRESLLVSKDEFSAPVENFIFKDKVIVLSFGVEKFSLIIESQHIAEAQLSIFNLLWNSLKELEMLRGRGQKSTKTQKR